MQINQFFRNNIPSSRHNQECPEEDSPSSIFKTMKVIKKTTVKQTQRDEAPVFANPFSYEMKKYLEKYGVIQTSGIFLIFCFLFLLSAILFVMVIKLFEIFPIIFFSFTVVPVIG